MEDSLRTLLEVYNRGDIEGTVALIHADAVAVVPPTMPNAGTYRGRDGVRAMLESWNEAWDEFRIDPRSFTRAGKAMLVSVHGTGRGRGSGVEVEVDQVWVVAERDGRIVLWRLCQSLGEAHDVVATEI